MNKKDIINGTISGLIVLVFGFGIEKLLLSKINWESINFVNFGEFMNNEITTKVYQIILIVILIFIFIFIFKMLKRRKKSGESYTSKQIRFREQFKKFEDEKNDVIFRLKIFFPDYENPSISDVEAYCNKHNFPMRFVGDHCPVQDCPNSKLRFDSFMERNAMESKLLDIWENY